MTNGPLSFGQERLWFLQRLDPEDPSYTTHYAYRVRGALDTGRLQAAFTEVAARHEPLRTRYPESADGHPQAVVEPPGPVPIERIDAGDLPAALAVVAERTNTAFDLAARPPLRITLIRLADDDHVLCVVLHHINADGWSINVLRREVAAFYDGRTLPEPALRYADHVRAERAEEPDVSWWAERLTGVPPLDLAADRPRPPVRSASGGEVSFEIPPALAAAVNGLARRARCTPYMVLLAAYQVLLARHSGQDDFCVGTPAAGRGGPEVEDLIGMFSTTLALRADLSGDPDFAELLARTRRGVLAALSHREVPFERLVGALGLDRDLSRTPLFQTMFAFHTHGDEDEPLPGLAAEPVPHGWHPARFDLSLDLYPRADGGVDGRAIYGTDLFDQDTVRRMTARYLVLLEGVTAGPDRPVSALPLLTADERELLLGPWNDSAADLPEVTLADLVLERAAETPDAVAVVHGETTLTYAELTRRAAGLAVRLAAEGIGRGDLVAVATGRGPEMPLALLGVAMSGAAYLPVDPDYPAARVDYVLADARVARVLTDEDVRRLAVPDPAGPLASARPGEPAYVLYTSGSTGRPKGVVVPHRALTNFLFAMRSLLGATADDTWLALTSLSFDISALELYLPLITGGRVVLAESADARDGEAVAALVARHGVTHVQATPSGWRMMPGVRVDTALTGGEPLPPALAAELRPRARRLFNVYGPTETTIWSTAWEVPDPPGEVAIGGPIANTTLHVVDRHGHLTPIGVPGELLIGGAGLADGYLRRPALTAERFVPDPYGPPGTRLYRTGDLARRRADGVLECLGRTDHQVKLRGHRIEPGEIEAVLESHPGVEQAVVTVRDETLVAFVVGSAPITELRAHAAAALPPYMVPAAFAELDALPLTPNGKVDRAALPGDARTVREEVVYTPPRSDAEELVADVYAEVLSLEKVGAHDDFFALGGHSLLATRVIARIRALTEVDVPIRTIFASGAVADLAQAVEELLAAEIDLLSDEEAARLAREQD
ncbi:amino acid adenylation domain-containing protein [Spongiactinospora sp. TRM90649]|uniref:amino acid adenylation domain-containing protein n=1 Tax=Spongiactinospora sp. TRM90649 TaxID=3031114 RepID=UPI0023F6A2E4|nr:amino acid adenylation domain-containing protein [Spongiactinospora sp. TRM90649]MDF5754041.1 amino acid adenylation domain-containing protein [Spongiactinospora sp. TRM90649]